MKEVQEFIQELIVYRLFDVLLPNLEHEDIIDFAYYLIDKDVKFTDVAHLIKSLYYDTCVILHVERDTFQDDNMMYSKYVEERKKGTGNIPQCSYCQMELNFYTYVSYRCNHPISLFCAVGASKHPDSYSCPKCKPSKKKSRLM